MGSYAQAIQPAQPGHITYALGMLGMYWLPTWACTWAWPGHGLGMPGHGQNFSAWAWTWAWGGHAQFRMRHISQILRQLGRPVMTKPAKTDNPKPPRPRP
jgi:hypothetical protein